MQHRLLPWTCLILKREDVLLDLKCKLLFLLLFLGQNALNFKSVPRISYRIWTFNDFRCTVLTRRCIRDRLATTLKLRWLTFAQLSVLEPVEVRLGGWAHVAIDRNTVKRMLLLRIIDRIISIASLRADLAQLKHRTVCPISIGQVLFVQDLVVWLIALCVEVLPMQERSASRLRLLLLIMLI